MNNVSDATTILLMVSGAIFVCVCCIALYETVRAPDPSPTPTNQEEQGTRCTPADGEFWLRTVWAIVAVLLIFGAFFFPGGGGGGGGDDYRPDYRTTTRGR